MNTQYTRRGFFALTGAAGLLAAAACAAEGQSAEGGGVTIAHAFGETTIPAKPSRVVSAGFTEQDSLLALGLVPIATTEWWGQEPYAVWPWAQPAIGGAQPVVLSLAEGIDVDQIAALTPDLIVAINAGCDAQTYERLSAIAPTVPQSGPAPFFEPWKDQAATIGRALAAGEQMTSLIAGVDDRFAAAAAANPDFQDKKVLLLQGSTYWENSVIATQPGWRTDFLTQLGFTISDAIGPFGREHDHRAFIPIAEIGPVLDDADVLIWTTESDEDQAKLLADPHVAALRATRENRNVFTGKELSGAIAFGSVLSYPVVADRLPPLLAAALN